jgi:signal transduction histidine kinase
MLSPFKLFRLKNPAILLNLYNILSLTVLMLCILSISFIYTFGYVKENKQRTNISLLQLEHFFDFQQRAMVEEYWSGNYEAIAMRVSEIAKKFGNAKYQLYVLNDTEKCLAEASTGINLSTLCTVSEIVKTKTHKRIVNKEVNKVSFDTYLDKYVYVGAFNFEHEKQGYFYVEISDPYGFYRGNLISKLWSDLSFKLLILLSIWISWLLISKRFILKPYYESLAKIEKRDALGNLAAQVAHDIQSPLAVLEMVVQATASISEDKRILIKNSVGRIKDIANNLLVTHHATVVNNAEDSYVAEERLTSQLASALIESIITEKRTQYRANTGVSIGFDLNSKDSYGLFVSVPLSNIKRVISNIINNAVEAISSSGKVTVTLKQEQNYVQISIQDNGIGISPDILTKLGQPGITCGKFNGNGLGIFHAKKIVNTCKGELIIESKQYEGTTVKILLPKAERPLWFVDAINIKKDTTICIVDDDYLIHQIWDKRLVDNLPKSYPKLNVINFSCPYEFINWKNANKVESDILYLCDYEFIDKNTNGITLIKELKIEHNAILVTGSYEERTVHEYCGQNGVKLLPKSMAAYIPINFI